MGKQMTTGREYREVRVAPRSRICQKAEAPSYDEDHHGRKDRKSQEGERAWRRSNRPERKMTQTERTTALGAWRQGL